MPATPTRTWNWWSSCSELRISLPRIRGLDTLLALRAPLRQEEERCHCRPEDRAGDRPHQDRPAPKKIARRKPDEQHRRLGGEQDERDVQRLQHGSEPQDTPRKPHGKEGEQRI